jgi:LmbE family N-acetylglucosaminyl deacetylase
VSRRLAAVVAHPDDDTFACSGSVALHALEPGFRFALVHVTSGEAGMISDPSLATPENLGEVREEEDRRSWIALGRPPDRHEFLRCPDGGLGDVPFDDLVDCIAEILRDERPDVVITFGPEGVTGHIDHITVGRATTEAFDRCRAEGGDGFRRLLYSSISDSLLGRFNEALVARGQEPIDSTQPFQPRAVPDETIGIEVDCSGVVDRMQAAIMEHRTQANGIPDDLEDEVFRYESHVVAWPERPQGSPVLRDVFEGLDRTRLEAR